MRSSRGPLVPSYSHLTEGQSGSTDLLSGDSHRALGKGMGLSGQGQVGVRERLCRSGTGNPEQRARLKTPGVQRVHGHCSHMEPVGFGCCCVEPRIDLDDPCESLPVRDVL